MATKPARPPEASRWWALAEPVDRVVLQADPELLAEEGRVLVAELAAELLRAVVGRVADDRVGGRPFHLQRVREPDPRERLERQHGLVAKPELPHRERVAHPERDAGKADGERLSLDSVQILEREERPRGSRLEAALGSKLLLEVVQPQLDPAQLLVGDVEEVARAAGRVEDVEGRERALRGLDVLERLARLEPGQPGLDDRRPHYLHDVLLLGVVRAEAPLALASQRALEQEAEDRRLDQMPVERGRLPQGGHLLRRQVHRRWLLEELPVHERGVLVQPVPGPVAGRVHELEEPAQIVLAGAARVADQADEELREHPIGKQPQVLGEHAPDALEDEVAERVRRVRLAFLELHEETGHELDGLARELGPIGVELRLELAKEAEHGGPAGQLLEVEHGMRVGVTGLPDLEPPEGAQDDVTRRLVLGAARLAPVIVGLPVVGPEVRPFARSLHLDKADARPEHVDERTRREPVLEPDARFLPVDAVAAEQLDQEGLCALLLGAAPGAPVLHERLEARPELLRRGRQPA